MGKEKAEMNFYRDNKDIENVIDALDLTEVAELREEGFRFAKEHAFAPKDAADAIDNYTGRRTQRSLTLEDTQLIRYVAAE